MIQQMDYDTYDKLEGERKSRLALFDESPEAFRYPPPRTPGRSLRLGSAADCLLFTPQEYADKFVAFPGRRDKRTKEYKDFLDQHPGKEILSVDEDATAHLIRDRVNANPDMRRVLTGRAQVAVTWTDPDHGVRLKGLLDVLGDGFVTDLKTSRAVKDSPWVLGRIVHDYGYHVQLAMYVDGCRANGRKIDNAYIAWVKNSAPWSTGVMRVPEHELDIGRRKYKGWLEQLVWCQERDEWPGPWEGVIDLWFPDFVYKEDENAGDVKLDWGAA